MRIWNGTFFQQWRSSFFNGTYSFCSPECPFFGTAFEQDVKIALNDIKEKKIILDHGPLILAYSADITCNLKCKSCRNEFKNQKSEFASFLRCANSGVIELEMTGSGEVLYSKETLSFLRAFKKSEYPDLKSIRLYTNGTLFSEEMWGSFSESKDVIKEIFVSVDACTDSTYFKIRGFDFKVLVKNLNFISSLRAENKIKSLGMNFVLQASNIKELYAFCLWAKELKVNVLRINKIANWGHMSDQEFSLYQIKKDDNEYINQVQSLKDFIIQNPAIKVITNVR
jgi:molybdenum cofactor biosynthesis enzyme MoaA